MVSRTSFLEKLRSRFSSSPVRVSKPEDTSRGTVGRAEPRDGTTPVRSRAVPESSRKLGRQEQAQLTLERGLADLSTELRRIRDRLEDPSANLSRLPELSQAQLTALQTLVDKLERQEASQERIVQHLESLPSTLQAVHKALEQAATTDERTASTLTQFKADMQRIESSMGDLVKTNREHSDATLEAMRENDSVAVAETVAERLSRESRTGLEAVHKAQTEHARKFEQLAGEERGTQRIMVALLAAVFVALVVIAGILASS